VVAGVPFTLTGAGCPSIDGTAPAYAVVLTDEAGSAEDLGVGASDPAGTWTVSMTFPAGTAPGSHEIGAVCRSSDSGEPTEFDYPIVPVTVERAPASQR
jgi:hypothetical protein